MPGAPRPGALTRVLAARAWGPGAWQELEAQGMEARLVPSAVAESRQALAPPDKRAPAGAVAR